MKKREIIHKTIFENGTCILSIRSPSDFEENTCGHYLLEDCKSLEEKEITDNVLEMISEAYYAGYLEATRDAKICIDRMLLNNSSPRKPKCKISETLDYRNTRA